LYLCFENQTYKEVAAKKKEFVLLVHHSSLFSAIVRQQPGNKLLLPHRTAEVIDRKENLITRIVCVTPSGWMDNSEYSDDDTIQELLLDAHQPVVVEKRAVESTRTHYRAQKRVKIVLGKKQETTTMRMIRIWTMNVVMHKIRNKTSKKGQYEVARKGQKEHRGRQQCGAVTESYHVGVVYQKATSQVSQRKKNLLRQPGCWRGTLT
jgi:hypothetical protein